MREGPVEKARMGSAGGEGLPRLFTQLLPLCCPAGGMWAGAGLAEVTRQAGDEGLCGVEVRGFESLASSVRERVGG